MTFYQGYNVSTQKTLRVLAIGFTLIGLFGFILMRHNLKFSLILQTIGTTSALSYVTIIKQEEEWSPLNKAWKDLEIERERINNQYIDDCKNYECQLLELRKEYEREKNEIKEYSLGEQKRIIELFENEIELYVEQLSIKESLLRQAKLPQLAKGISRTETYANRIINYLYSRDIECDFADSWAEPGFDLIRLIPKNASLRHFKELADDLQLELRLTCQPLFEIVSGCIQIKIDTRLVDTAKDTKSNKLKLVTGDWLTEVAKKIVHAKVDGETGSGKSTFVCNLANVLSSIHNNADFIAIDPKYPLSLDWESDLNDWQRKPKYPGIDKALDGLIELSSEIKRRLELVTLDVQSGGKPRSFNKRIYLVDEIDWIILEYGKEATDNLQVGLKIGRALDEIVIYFGQTPRCSKLKMLRDDFRNSTNISLGSNIPDAISTYIFDEAYGRGLLELYESEMSSGNKYLALVSQVGSKPFLAQLPQPNEYKSLQINKTGKSMVSNEVNTPVDKPLVNRETIVSKDFTELDARNIYPDMPEDEVLALWGKLSELLSSKGKTYVIEDVLECRGKYYKKGCDYLEYLREKYG